MIDPEFECWIGDDETDVSDMVGYRDAEHAATDFADQWLRFDADRGAKHVDGDPIVVHVRDEFGDVSTWEVQATSSIQFEARQIAGGGD